MSVLPERKRRRPKIDVVPLIDVLMVLIIFFLVTMQFQDLRAINVKLPKIDSAGSNLLKNELVVSIDEKGLFYLNGKTVSEEKIISIFETVSRLPVKPTILVVADEEVSLKFVTRIVDLCRQNELQDFRLQAR
jgi:biopolymer transport protein ExbD